MQISKLLFWLITILWFLAGTFWYRSCSPCHNCGSNGTETTAIESSAALPGFTISDGNWSAQTPSNIRFGLSSDVPVMDGQYSILMDSIVAYALRNPNKGIDITGFFSPTEKSASGSSDLGLARAEALKSFFVSKGIDASRLQVKGQSSDQLTFSPQDTLVGGIGYQFFDIAQPAPVVEKETLFEPRTIYFNTGHADFPTGNEWDAYIKGVIDYLAANPNKKLSVVGYADNVGQVEKNQILSENRASSVKDQLISKGIDGSKIVSSGMGVKDPIADNNTSEGRAKNRRVTIQLQ